MNEEIIKTLLHIVNYMEDGNNFNGVAPHKKFVYYDNIIVIKMSYDNDVFIDYCITVDSILSENIESIERGIYNKVEILRKHLPSREKDIAEGYEVALPIKNKEVSQEPIKEERKLQCKDIDLTLILQLIYAHRINRDTPFAYEILTDMGFPINVIYAKYIKLNKKGYVEYGVSIRTGWLTDEGIAKLKELGGKL